MIVFFLLFFTASFCGLPGAETVFGGVDAGCSFWLAVGAGGVLSAVSGVCVGITGGVAAGLAVGVDVGTGVGDGVGVGSAVAIGVGEGSAFSSPFEFTVPAYDHSEEDKFKWRQGRTYTLRIAGFGCRPVRISLPLIPIATHT